MGSPGCVGCQRHGLAERTRVQARISKCERQASFCLSQVAFGRGSRHRTVDELRLSTGPSMLWRCAAFWS